MGLAGLHRLAATVSIAALLSGCAEGDVSLARLLGTEAENDIRDLYTFQCAMCEKLEVRGVLVAAAK